MISVSNCYPSETADVQKAFFIFQFGFSSVFKITISVLVQNLNTSKLFQFFFTEIVINLVTC